MKNKKGFQDACRVYLNTHSIGNLRSYGRSVGVAQPTAKNKDILIEEIIAVLTGDLQPVAISRQGAPVKNSRVDERIPAKIKEIQQSFVASSYDFAAEYQNRPKAADLRVADEKGADCPTHSLTGQVDGRFVLPVNGKSEQGRAYIPAAMMEEYDLREGDILAYFAKREEDGLVVREIVAVNGVNGGGKRPRFDEIPVAQPTEKIRVCEGNNAPVSTKLIEWLAPIAKGQRGCVVSPPKVGKTRLLLQLAKSISRQNKEVEAYVLLVDKSPEEIGAFRLAFDENNLFYTTYEDDAERQVFLADFLIKRLKCKAATGKDVVLLVDSLTALAHAFNDTDESAGGKTLSCGLELKTLQYIKRFFASARNLEGAGSITVLAAVDDKTGNPMDEVLRSEISARANYEIVLSEELASRRVYPALDLLKINAKQTESFRSEKEEEFDAYLRSELLSKIPPEALLKLLEESDTYEQFIEKI